MKFVTTSYLINMFKLSDNKQVFRKRNIKQFVRDNKINYHIVNTVYLINYNDFLEKINPLKISKHYKIPKVRTMISAVKEYNETHQDKINIHTLERLRNEKNLPCCKDVRLCLFNYDKVVNEIEIDKYKHNRLFRRRYNKNRNSN